VVLLVDFLSAWCWPWPSPPLARLYGTKQLRGYGTLTECRPTLTAVLPLHDMGEQDLLCVAAVAEKFSEHPLGRDIVQAALDRGLSVADPEEFTVLPGLGVLVNMYGSSVILGRPQLLEERGITLDAEIKNRADQIAAVGRTVIVAVRDDQVIGMLVLEDTPRPEVQEVIVRLKSLGFEPCW
jgi:P-type E1-E2 ATPase